jgi:hypothetical protein
MKYQTKHKEVTAIQYDGENLNEVQEFCGDQLQPIEKRPGYEVKLTDGTLVRINDYIVNDGSFTVMSRKVFEDKYEAI